MDALAYYLARKKGEDPDLAMESPGVQDSTPDTAPQGQPTPPLQTSAPPPQAPPDPSTWTMPSFPAQPPPGPPPAPQPPAQQAPGGISAQLAAALARGQQRQAMPAELGDDALTKSMESDEQDANRNKVIESLRAAFTRQQPQMATDSGPSAATKGLMQRRQTFQANDQQDRSDALKAAEILKGEQPKPMDPSLAALHEASATNLAGLEQSRRIEEERRRGEDTRKATVADTAKAEADASVEQQRVVLAHDPRLKKMGITPEMISKLDRKGIEDLTHELGGHGAAGAGGPKVKALPAEQLASLGDFDTAAKNVDDLAAAHKAAGMSAAGSQAASMIPSGIANFTGIGTKSAEYNDKARATAQVVGYILEGGKLSDADVPRYLKMLPGPGDSPERVDEKAANIRHLLQQKKEGRIKEFAAGGYNAPGAKPDSAGGDSVKMSNGDETRMVPRKHLAAAQADGYSEVK